MHWLWLLPQAGALLVSTREMLQVHTGGVAGRAARM